MKKMTLEDKRMVIAEQLARSDLNEVQLDFWLRSAESAGMPLYRLDEEDPKVNVGAVLVILLMLIVIAGLLVLIYMQWVGV